MMTRISEKKSTFLTQKKSKWIIENTSWQEHALKYIAQFWTPC